MRSTMSADIPLMPVHLPKDLDCWMRDASSLGNGALGVQHPTHRHAETGPTVLAWCMWSQFVGFGVYVAEVVRDSASGVDHTLPDDVSGSAQLGR